MEAVVLVIHLFLALAIIGLVLIQRSEGGGLGIGGGGGGMGNLASAKGTANFLTKATTVCAIAFFCTSLVLGIMAGQRGISEGLFQGAPYAPSVEQESDADTEGVGTPEIPPAPSVD